MQLTPAAVQRIFKAMVYVADCPDGIDSNEGRVLGEFVSQYALKAADVERLWAEGKSREALEAAQSEAEQVVMMNGMIEVVAADGVLDHNEQERLLNLADDLALPKQDMRARLLDRLMGG